ncbi:immunoglobulin kappa light chain-like [Chanos chanos]|uniref:immunoglobulin kappa light chain-like n=1 Tax=Chanos chanos TaxID=29144 RepID=UPI0011F27F1E|nr:immunoglobulin kappa light chain-like [Chanos chanos]
MAQIQAREISQPDRVIMVVLGETVTLQCLITKETGRVFFWYKQTVGEKPQLVMQAQSLAVHSFENVNHSRFKAEQSREKINLIIENTEPSDEATYFCGVQILYSIIFGEGTFLTFSGNILSHITVVQNPVSGSIHPGDTVTLQCTVLAERSTAELNVFWFRPTSEETHPGTIYTSKNNSNQCQTTSKTKNCVYNLANVSHAGTYYCAVAICGKILFGNGTNLKIAKEQQGNVFGVGVALGLCAVVILILSCAIFSMRIYKQNKDVHGRQDLDAAVQRSYELHPRPSIPDAYSTSRSSKHSSPSVCSAFKLFKTSKPSSPVNSTIQTSRLFSSRNHALE